MNSGYLRVIAPLALGLIVAGCAAQPRGDLVEGLEVTTAALPTKVKPYPRIERTLACIRSTGVLHSKTFLVGSFADSTGKINAIAPGATGNFVPQGGSAAYVTDAIRKAGGRVVSTYFGAPAVKVDAQYAINGIFNSLDFSTPVAVDARVNGIGPTAGMGWAQLTLSIQLDQAKTRLNRQMSMIQRPVRYRQLGIGTGRVFGNTLLTGNLVVQNQERLQFEALNGPIALGVADVVMREFPEAADACLHEVEDLLSPHNEIASYDSVK